MRDAGRVKLKASFPPTLTNQCLTVQEFLAFADITPGGLSSSNRLIVLSEVNAAAASGGTTPTPTTPPTYQVVPLHPGSWTVVQLSGATPISGENIQRIGDLGSYVRDIHPSATLIRAYTPGFVGPNGDRMSVMSSWSVQAGKSIRITIPAADSNGYIAAPTITVL